MNRTISVNKTDDGKWTISDRHKAYHTQIEAIEVAKKVAKQRKSYLVVHKASGVVSTKYTRDYTQRKRPRIFGKRSISDAEILAAIVTVKENQGSDDFADVAAG